MQIYRIIKRAVRRFIHRNWHDAFTAVITLVVLFQFAFPQHASAAGIHSPQVAEPSEEVVTATSVAQRRAAVTDAVEVVPDPAYFEPIVHLPRNADKPTPPPVQIARTMTVVATAYSSTPEETDSSPFITASGSHVHDGTLAANFLSFGTTVRLPDLYGEKVFVVEDRMHPRFSRNHVDLWMPAKSLAKQFGKKHTTLEILE